MMGGRAWLRLAYVWAIPAALVALNAVWLLGLRSAVLGRGSILVRQRVAVENEVASLKRQRESLAATQTSLNTLQSDLGSLRMQQLGSMRERLVAFLVDVARRTQSAGLQPERISYSAQRDSKSGLVHFAATFAVSGTYEEVRRCINLLEASPHFLVVERLSLRSQDPTSSVAVAVQVAVGTYFTDVDVGLLRDLGVEELPPATQPAAGAGIVAETVPTPAPEEPRTDFSAVDAEILEDVRTAVSGLGEEDVPVREIEGDVFTEPDEEVRESGRRPRRSRPTGDRQTRQETFVGTIGAREISRGR